MSLSAPTPSADTTVARLQRLGDLPRRAARRNPAKTAIVDGPVRLTFAAFDEYVDRVSSAMAGAGLRRGDTLALLSHNCWQYPVIAFAAARRGIVLVPVSFMLGASEISYILDHCGARAFVVEDALVPVAEAALGLSGDHCRTLVRLDLDPAVTVAATSAWTPVSAWLDHATTGLADEALADDEPLRVMYTSGTESRPKGAVLSSRSLLWQYTSCIATGGMEASDVELHSMPLYHCAQLDNFLSTKVYLGATSVILRRPRPRPDPADDRAGGDHEPLPAADRVDQPAGHARVRDSRSEHPGQGLLRCVGHAARGTP